MVNSVSDSGIIPLEFRLFDPYPNPFNASTIIRYQLPKSQHVALRIYDVTGREIATLMNEQMQAGCHRILWDAQSIPTGVYFVKMEANAFSAIRKVVLVK